MNAIAYRTDDPIREIRRIVRRHGFRIDPIFPGECESLREDSNIRRQYYRRNGFSLESLAIALHEENVTVDRVDGRDVIEMLEWALRGSMTYVTVKTEAGNIRRRVDQRTRYGAAELRAIATETGLAADTEIQKIRNNRRRTYDCPGCGDIAWHSGFNWPGVCPFCGEVYTCRDLGKLSQISADVETASVPF